MSGEIGVTAAGKLLDVYLTENNPPYRARLVRLIKKVSIKCKALRAAEMEPAVREHLLGLVRDHYLDHLIYDLKPLMCEFAYTMTKQHVIAMTRLHFTPYTATQRRIAAAGTA